MGLPGIQPFPELRGMSWVGAQAPLGWILMGTARGGEAPREYSGIQATRPDREHSGMQMAHPLGNVAGMQVEHPPGDLAGIQVAHPARDLAWMQVEHPLGNVTGMQVAHPPGDLAGMQVEHPPTGHGRMQVTPPPATPRARDIAAPSLPCREGSGPFLLLPSARSRESSCGKRQSRAGRGQTPNVLKATPAPGESLQRRREGAPRVLWDGSLPPASLHGSHFPASPGASGISPFQPPLPAAHPKPHPEPAAAPACWDSRERGRSPRAGEGGHDAAPRGFAIFLRQPASRNSCGSGWHGRHGAAPAARRPGKARAAALHGYPAPAQAFGLRGEMPAPFMPEKAATSGLCCWMSPSPSHRREKSIRKN